MANEAHKEPTMEEILASIRKIISEDDASTTRRPGAPAAVRAEAVAESHDAELSDFSETAFDAAEEDIDEAMFDVGSDDNYETVDAADESDEAESFEGLLDAARAVDQPEPAPIFRHQPEPAPVFQQAPEPAPRPAPQPAPRPQSHAPTETDMPASARYQNTVLTDDKTSDAAAGSLGKLMSKMDTGSDNTIEGLVRELLKPMIKEWLDTNLPGIVEEKVEAEVQRIARMAR
ncbi:DUF2497 domain-containing protein [Hyphomonas sp.]|uniref:DUF2497 domain-containing protein n=1 Tax=Hyphomonas sp. TaxID=87 RepID=UPI003566BA4C